MKGNERAECFCLFSFSHDLSVSACRSPWANIKQNFFLLLRLFVLILVLKTIKGNNPRSRNIGCAFRSFVNLPDYAEKFQRRIMKPVNKRKINLLPRRRKIEIVRAWSGRQHFSSFRFNEIKCEMGKACNGEKRCSSWRFQRIRKIDAVEPSKQSRLKFISFKIQSSVKNNSFERCLD